MAEESDEKVDMACVLEDKLIKEENRLSVDMNLNLNRIQ